MMKDGKIPGYAWYYIQKRTTHDWDDETIANWYRASEGMERMEAWFKKAGLILLYTLLGLLSIAFLALVGFGIYYFYKIGAWKHMAIFIGFVVLCVAITWLGEKKFPA